MLTLWDLIEPIVRGLGKKPERDQVTPPKVAPPASAPSAPSLSSPSSPSSLAPAPAARAKPRSVSTRRKADRLAHPEVLKPPGVSVLDRQADESPVLAAAIRREIAKESAQERYDRIVAHMLEKYDIRVRKWRSGMSGIAWYVTYRDGRISRLIESPKPKGPMSIAVFLHEIGHHAIGFHRFKPRCLEEYHAWAWAIAAMEEHGLNITPAVRYRMHASLWYAVSKAQRRGIKSIPAELTPYLERPKKVKGARVEQ